VVGTDGELLIWADETDPLSREENDALAREIRRAWARRERALQRLGG
jgi:hypothetical protein